MLTGRMSVIWAVNPFERSDEALRAGARALRSLEPRPGRSRIQPVFVWGASVAELLPELADRGEEQLRCFARERVRRVLLEEGAPEARALVVRGEPAFGIRGGVEGLLEVSRRAGADLILAATHSREGADRLIQGSFVETLIQRSEIPVLTVHPGWDGARLLEPILFPTDLTERSSAAFDAVLDLAAERDAAVMVHHVVSFPAYESHEFSFTHPAVYQRGLDAQARACAGRAEPLARRARERGLRAEVSIDAGRGKIAESILRRAQGCGLIAMASRSGPVSTVLFGSVTRWVVRKAEAPVLVLGSRGPGRVGAEDGLPAASAGGIEGLAAERLRS